VRFFCSDQIHFSLIRDSIKSLSQLLPNYKDKKFLDSSIIRNCISFLSPSTVSSDFAYDFHVHLKIHVKNM
jgi:hypothetical protein